MNVFLENKDVKPQKSFDSVPIFSNLILVMISALLLLGIVSFFRNKIESISSWENRLITMEWDLLQEMKQQTDKKLLEKESQISELRERYALLEQQNGSSFELNALEEQLKKAEAELDQISSQAQMAGENAGNDVSIPFAALPDSSPSPDLSKLLLVQINKLETELADARSYSLMLEKQAKTIENSQKAIKPGDQETITKTSVETTSLDGKLPQILSEIMVALNDLKQKKIELDQLGVMGLDDLNTWSLLRALASTPSIKTDYPDLLPAVEKYFASFGQQKILDGRREAYTAIISSLEYLVQRLGIK